MIKKSGYLFLGVLFMAFMLVFAGCNSESSSSENSAAESPSSENASSENTSVDTASVKNPAAETSAGEDGSGEDSEAEESTGESGPDKTATGGSASEAPSAEKGTLALYLTDATTNYQGVYVTISEIQVCFSESDEAGEEEDVLEGEDALEEEGEWITVAEPAQTYNLLELVNGVMAQLGTTELETGHYTMLRMILGETPDGETNLLGYEHPYPNYIITGSDEEIEMFVPSGYQTGIKLVSGFDIIAGAATELVLDFDASRSVVKAGQSGKYLLKPTIKVVDSISRADVNGVVTGPDGEGIPGAIVSAQIYNEGDEEAGTSPSVEVFTSTQTDEDGSYRMYLPAGDYNIVAYKGPEEGEATAYGPGCKRLEADYNFNYTENVDLETNDTGTLAVTIEILPEQEQTVSVRAWKTVECDGRQVHVELPPPLNVTAAVQIETHEMVLPGGSYTILASTEETVLQEENVTIGADAITEVAFSFLGEDASEENGDNNGEEG